MKLRIFALILALSFVVWAQQTPAPSAPNSTPTTEAKGCCHHADEAKNAEGCCHHAKGEARDAADCCGKDMAKCEMKDAKSCCEGKNMKTCMKDCKKGSKSCGGESTEKQAKNCCGKACSRHQHTPVVS